MNMAMTVNGTYIALAATTIFAIIVIGQLIMLAKFYHKAQQGTALVRNGLGGTRIAFDGIIVLPIVHIHERIDLSTKKVTISFRGDQPALCKDGKKADLDMAFLVRINKTREDVLQVAEAIGCERAGSEEGLTELFYAKFYEAVKVACRKFDLLQMLDDNEGFKSEILLILGRDLNGYLLEDVGIGYIAEHKEERI